MRAERWAALGIGFIFNTWVISSKSLSNMSQRSTLLLNS